MPTWAVGHIARRHLQIYIFHISLLDIFDILDIMGKSGEQMKRLSSQADDTQSMASEPWTAIDDQFEIKSLYFCSENICPVIAMIFIAPPSTLWLPPRWTGMIAELRSQKADMAVIDMSVTSIRQTAVDFTMPFMSTGVRKKKH